MYLRLNEGTNPADSLALYAADNPNGPARRIHVIKPLTAPPPVGGTVLSVSHNSFQEVDCYYYWLDHGPGGFPTVRDPRTLDVVANVDNAICYTWWHPQFGDRPEFDPPDITEISDPGLDGGRTLTITWELSDDDASVDWYNIYRAVGTFEGHDSFHWIRSLPRGTSSLFDEGLSPGVSYVYMVSAAHHGSHGGMGGVNRGIWNDFGAPVAGVPVNDFPIVRGLVRRYGTGTIDEMPASTAFGCPKGDRDEIVVEILLDPAIFGGLSAGSLSLTQPVNGLGVFFHESTPIPADSNVAILPPDLEFVAGYGRTTFTISAFTGCGIDSALVSANGMPLGYAQLKTKSYDVSGTVGIVNLPDLAMFSNAYPSSKCNCVYAALYLPCVDYAMPDTTVNLVDFAQWWPHYGHEVTGGGSSPEAVSETTVGTVLIELEEVHPLIGEHKLRAQVSLEGVEPFELAVFALHNASPKLEFMGWAEADDLERETLCIEAVRDGRKEVVIGVLGKDGQPSGATTLGTAEFRVHSDQELVLGEEDLALVTADLLSTGSQRALAVSSMDVRRAVSSVRYENALAQNYPNPFNPTTTISFSLARSANASLSIYDVRGSLVRRLVDERKDRGIHRVVWDGMNSGGQRVASGVYFYKLIAGSFTDTKKMTTLK